MARPDVARARRARVIDVHGAAERARAVVRTPPRSRARPRCARSTGAGSSRGRRRRPALPSGQPVERAPSRRRRATPRIETVASWPSAAVAVTATPGEVARSSATPFASPANALAPRPSSAAAVAAAARRAAARHADRPPREARPRRRRGAARRSARRERWRGPARTRSESRARRERERAERRRGRGRAAMTETPRLNSPGLLRTRRTVRRAANHSRPARREVSWLPGSRRRPLRRGPPTFPPRTPRQWRRRPRRLPPATVAGPRRTSTGFPVPPSREATRRVALARVKCQVRRAGAPPG